MNKKLIILIASIVVVAAIVFTVCLTNNGSSDSSSSDSSSIVETNTATVTFETNGGSEIASVEVEKGESITLSDYLTEKENSYFYGWCLDVNLTERASNVLCIEGDCTLYAEWGNEEKYLLSFVTGDDNVVVDGVLYAPGTYLAAPEAPVRDNYSFVGWYKDADCTREFIFAGNTMPRRNLTVYAKWIELHAIYFDSNGGSEVETLTGEVGEAVSAPDDPVLEGYVFEGWFLEDETAYEITEIPETSVTVYAKWHVQAKNVNVTLTTNANYLNVENKSYVLTADEGTDVEDISNYNAQLDLLVDDANGSLKDYFIDDKVDLTKNPFIKFYYWSTDEDGQERFDGKVPSKDVTLYANWTRSALYSEITFLATQEGEKDRVYLVVKGSVIPKNVLEAIENPLKEQYEAFGCNVDGFYTQSGERYVAGQTVAMDMVLSPYLYSLDLVYKYGGLYNASGNVVYGYMVCGYDPDSKNVTKASNNLVLKIPDIYNDGKNGSASVLWIDESAFEGYNIIDVTLSNKLLGISDKAFKGTKITKIEIPASVFELDDYIFADSDLNEIVFKGSTLSWIGQKIYQNTPYESNLPKDDDGFIYFNSYKNIIYGFDGTSTEITTPEGVTVIAGGAFRDDTVIQKFTFGDNLTLVCNNAFENSAIREVTFGQKFKSMGYYVFKDCKKLNSINFTYEYNLTYLGYGMFQGCTALKNADFSKLYSLKYVYPYAFEGCTSLSQFKVCQGVSTSSGNVSYFLGVYDHAFENCTRLTKVAFPSTLSFINEYAFANSGLSDLSVGSLPSLETVGEYAFANTQLYSVNWRTLSQLTVIEKGTFSGCEQLIAVTLSNYVTEVKENAFEKCSKLMYVNFGISSLSKLEKIGDYAFEDCTSLRKIVIWGILISDNPVSFGESVFKNASYDLNDGVGLRKPVVYVQPTSPEYSTTSQWKNGTVMYSYREIYEKVLTKLGSDYEGISVMVIDQVKPTITINKAVINSSELDGYDLSAFDVASYFKTNEIYTVSDNDSEPENCEVVIMSVVLNANGKETTVKADDDGLYDISTNGTYVVKIGASDEFGNSSYETVQIVVSSQSAS